MNLETMSQPQVFTFLLILSILFIFLEENSNIIFWIT